jgi:hypothetical protein
VFADADRVAREAEFVDEVRLPAPVRRKLTAYVTARARLRADQTRVRDAAQGIAKALTRTAKISLRDAGELLGLSRERVRRLTA